MPRATPLQPSLNAGELGPRMVARTDFAKYPLGCATLENMLPLPQGGAARRPGTRFVAAAKTADGNVRLIPFQFSTEQAYVIEAGEGYFRFYTDGGRIAAAATDAAITNGDFTAGIAGWTDLSTGSGVIAHDPAEGRMDLVAAGAANPAHAEQAVAVGASYQAVQHVLRFRIAGAAGDTVSLRIGTSSGASEVLGDRAFATGWHTVVFTPGAATVYVQFRSTATKTLQLDDVKLLSDEAVEIATPHTSADLSRLKVAQSADTMWLCTPARPVLKLTRSAHAAWSLTEALFHDGPWLPANATATTLALSAATGTGITITASGAGGINGGAGFQAGDVGRLVRIAHGGDWGHALITAVGSTTSVTADVKTGFAATSAQTDWRLGAWSGTTGYPAAVTFYEQRLAFAGTADRPQTFWLSQSGDFENMRPDDGAGTVEDDDALDYTISADQVNAIRWMAPGRQLLLGTVGGEWQARSDGPLLTPTDIDVKRQTAFGTADVAPQQMRGRLLFLQRAGRKVLEFAFSFEVDNFQGLDLTLLADHVSKGGLTGMAYQQELDSTLWCVRADGELCALVYQPDQNVVGWSRHVLGGSHEGGKARAEAVCTIPGAAADEVWLAVRRTVDGATLRSIERLAAPFEAGDDPAAACYADAALVHDDPRPVTDVTAADPVEVTVAGHGFATGDRVRLDGLAGMSALDGGVFAIEATGSDTFTLADRATGAGIDGSGLGPYYGGGTVRRLETAFAGLDHLEGETVAVLADAAVHPPRVVSGGAIALEAPAATVVAGLPYAHVYESLKWEAGAATGTAQGQTKRIHGVTVMLMDALNARIGPTRDRLRTVPFRSPGDAMDSAVPFFTGERFVSFDGDYDTDSRVVIEGDDPAPFTLLAVAPALKTNSR